MNTPGSQGKSAAFWIVLAVGICCAVCSVLTLGTTFLWAFIGEDVRPPVSAIVRSPRSRSLPTGHTPNLYPGSPGWLPSGKGVKIPAASIVDGRPVGVWWHFSVLSDGKTMGPIITLFLPDGTSATNPRWGEGDLFDLEGQRAQPGNTGIGSFEVNDGTITQTGSSTSTDPFQFGGEGDDAWFEIGAAKYSPLTPPTEKRLVGVWKSPGAKYTLMGDGTFESEIFATAGSYVIAGGSRGEWQLDGYLLAIRPMGAPSWITNVGMSGEFLIIGAAAYTK